MGRVGRRRVWSVGGFVLIGPYRTGANGLEEHKQGPAEETSRYCGPGA